MQEPQQFVVAVSELPQLLPLLLQAQELVPVPQPMQVQVLLMRQVLLPLLAWFLLALPPPSEEETGKWVLLAREVTEQVILQTARSRELMVVVTAKVSVVPRQLVVQKDGPLWLLWPSLAPPPVVVVVGPVEVVAWETRVLIPP